MHFLRQKGFSLESVELEQRTKESATFLFTCVGPLLERVEDHPTAWYYYDENHRNHQQSLHGMLQGLPDADAAADA